MRRRRDLAYEIFKEMAKTIREKQDELEKAISEYKTMIPERPNMDVIETEDKIIVKTDLPGVKKEDIKVDLTEDSLDISAEFEEEIEVEEGRYIKRERRYGKAKRTFTLPAKVKVDEARAKFENGVLTVDLPKLEKKERFKVEID